MGLTDYQILATYLPRLTGMTCTYPGVGVRTLTGAREVVEPERGLLMITEVVAAAGQSPEVDTWIVRDSWIAFHIPWEWSRAA